MVGEAWRAYCGVETFLGPLFAGVGDRIYDPQHCVALERLP
jgi:hypothetical protein